MKPLFVVDCVSGCVAGRSFIANIHELVVSHGLSTPLHLRMRRADTSCTMSNVITDNSTGCRTITTCLQLHDQVATHTLTHL